MHLASKAANLFTFRKSGVSPNQVKKTKSFDSSYAPSESGSNAATIDKAVLSRNESFDKRLDKITTSDYVVKENESLNSIAVRFNITPSALAKINKFPSAKTNIFPGQRIKIPNEPLVCLPSSSLSPNSLTERKAPGLATRQKTSLPPNKMTQRPHSMIEVGQSSNRRKSADPSALNVRENHFDEEDEEVIERQFVKLPVERVLLPQRNYLKGTLLVTPEVLLFDPIDAEDELANHSNVIFGVSLPLANISSMNTHFSLDELLEDKSPRPSSSDKEVDKKDLNEKLESTRIESPINTNPLTIVDEVSAETKDGIEENAQNKSDQPTGEDCVFESRPISTDISQNEETGEKDYPTEASQQSPANSTSERESPIEDNETGDKGSSSSTPKHQNETQTTEASPSRKALYLSLRGLEEHEAESLIPGLSSPPSPKLFLFLVSDTEIASLYAFLLESTASNSNSAKSPNKKETEAESHDGNYQDLSWEVIDQTAIPDPAAVSVVANALRDMEEESFRPVLKDGESLILIKDEMLDELALNFPLHLTGCNLKLLFATTRDGFSLHSIYRKLKNESGCILLLIRDSQNVCFGALMSEKMHSSQYFYGNGETFVFHWNPNFQKYTWTGSNNYFMKGDGTCFSIGAKSGHNAIWFDDILKNGRSEVTDTFDNPVLCGGKSSAFTIDCLEVWGFVS